MKHTLERLPGSQVKIKVELTAEEFQPYKEKAAKEISANVEIPGFRKGFAPLEIVEKHVGEHGLLHEAIDHAIRQTYPKIAIDEKLDVITAPKINVVSENPLVYEATIAVMPEVKVKDYKSIKIPKEEIKIEEKEINEIVEDLRRRRAEHKDIDRPAKKGDKVELDFEGFDEGGASLEGTKSKNHPIIIGEGVLLKDFETQLEGMKTGDKKEFDITFPADYRHKPFANKKVKFKVEAKKTEEVILPELTEAFIKEVVGEPITVADFHKRIGENLKAEKEHHAHNRREDKLIEKILSHTETEIPELLLQEEIEYMLEQLKNDFAGRGIKFEEYLKQTKKTESDVRKELTKEAEKRIKIRFALQYLFKAEKIEVTDSELNSEIEKIIKSYPEKEQTRATEELNRRESQNQIRNRLALKKLFDIFLA
ncbi:trigger factor [Candidatus Peregrinibacteria bacterium]|nr:trigger factor [Candidatus Peregrinibacteria bacterium]